MTSPLFNGIKEKQINLSGSSSTSANNGLSDLVDKARQGRLQRELMRKKTAAGAKISRFIIGRRKASEERRAILKEFDVIISGQHLTGTDIRRASQILMCASRTNPKFCRDALSKWCRIVAGQVPGTSTMPVLFLPFTKDNLEYQNLVSLLCTTLVHLSAATPLQAQTPLFLEVIRLFFDEKSRIKYKLPSIPSNLINWVFGRQWYRDLRTIMQASFAVPLNAESLSKQIQPLVFNSSFSLAMVPLTASPEMSNPLQEFCRSILTLDHLITPSKIKPLQKRLLASFPFVTCSRIVNNNPFHLESRIESSNFVFNWSLIASTVLLGKPEIITNADSLKHVLRALTFCISQFKKLVDHREALSLGVNGMEVEKSDSSEIQPLLSTRFLSTIISISTKYSSSRPDLARFLVPLLDADKEEREGSKVRDTLSSALLAPNGGAGILRELYRGWFRSSHLAKVLGSLGTSKNLLKGTKDILLVITASPEDDSELRGTWAILVLIVELYERTLITMGDDEFFGTDSIIRINDTTLGSSSKETFSTASTGRNPFSLDEIIGLSTVLRNLAWVLYWNEADLFPASSVNEGNFNLDISITRLRELTTRLLTRIYSRDSRKQFTPEGHWIMSNLIDLESFIDSVIIEEQMLQESQLGEIDLDSDGEGRPYIAHHLMSGISKRNQNLLSPRLGILNNLPFVIPFETRVAIFRQFIMEDMRRSDANRFRRGRRTVIRRNNIAEDAFAHLSNIGAELKGRIDVVFVDQFGMEESGIDGGGLFKELLTGLSKEVFNVDKGLWRANEAHEIYPTPSAYARESGQLQWYSFIGRILGKALYSGILVDVRFARFFLAKWLGKMSYLDDLVSLDPDLYKGLLFLKNYAGNVETDLSLNFTVTENEFGEVKTFELIPRGAETPVTNENRLLYIYSMSNYRLNTQISKQCEAFFGGLSEIVPPRYLRLFNQSELRALVGGVEESIDLEDLYENTVYGGWPQDEANATIRMFWEVLAEFTQEEKALFLKFVTSCERSPLLGFSHLNPKFAIRNAGQDVQRLPTSSTCVNLLKLPEYKTKQEMKSKLLYAINSGAGFDLS